MVAVPAVQLTTRAVARGTFVAVFNDRAGVIPARSTTVTRFPVKASTVAPAADTASVSPGVHFTVGFIAPLVMP